MSNFTKSAISQSSQLNNSISDKVSVIKRMSDGSLLSATVSNTVASKLKTLDPQAQENYLKQVLQPLELESDSQRQKEAFSKAFHNTFCFYCEDKGFLSLKEKRSNGYSYDFAYRCTCQDQIENPKELIGAWLTSIHEVAKAGIIELTCQLGGKDGSLCPLTTKSQKCKPFNCPKFKA